MSNNQQQTEADREREFLNQPADGSGRTIGEYHEAFAQVATEGDWRAKINAVVEAAELALIVNAIQFMTGTVAKFEAILEGADKGRFRIRAVGYRDGPCGP